MILLTCFKGNYGASSTAAITEHLKGHGVDIRGPSQPIPSLILYVTVLDSPAPSNSLDQKPVWPKADVYSILRDLNEDMRKELERERKENQKLRDKLEDMKQLTDQFIATMKAATEKP